MSQRNLISLTAVLSVGQAKQAMEAMRAAAEGTKKQMDELTRQIGELQKVEEKDRTREQAQHLRQLEGQLKMSTQAYREFSEIANTSVKSVSALGRVLQDGFGKVNGSVLKKAINDIDKKLMNFVGRDVKVGIKVVGADGVVKTIEVTKRELMQLRNAMTTVLDASKKGFADTLVEAEGYLRAIKGLTQAQREQRQTEMQRHADTVRNIQDETERRSLLVTQTSQQAAADRDAAKASAERVAALRKAGTGATAAQSVEASERSRKETERKTALQGELDTLLVREGELKARLQELGVKQTQQTHEQAVTEAQRLEAFEKFVALKKQEQGVDLGAKNLQQYIAGLEEYARRKKAIDEAGKWKAGSDRITGKGGISKLVTSPFGNQMPRGTVETRLSDISALSGKKAIPENMIQGILGDYQSRLLQAARNASTSGKISGEAKAKINEQLLQLEGSLRKDGAADTLRKFYEGLIKQIDIDKKEYDLMVAKLRREWKAATPDDVIKKASNPGDASLKGTIQGSDISYLRRLVGVRDGQVRNVEGGRVGQITGQLNKNVVGEVSLLGSEQMEKLFSVMTNGVAIEKEFAAAVSESVTKAKEQRMVNAELVRSFEELKAAGKARLGSKYNEKVYASMNTETVGDRLPEATERLKNYRTALEAAQRKIQVYTSKGSLSEYDEKQTAASLKAFATGVDGMLNELGGKSPQVKKVVGEIHKQFETLFNSANYKRDAGFKQAVDSQFASISKSIEHHMRAAKEKIADSDAFSDGGPQNPAVVKSRLSDTLAVLKNQLEPLKKSVISSDDLKKRKENVAAVQAEIEQLEKKIPLEEKEVAVMKHIVDITSGRITASQLREETSATTDAAKAKEKEAEATQKELTAVTAARKEKEKALATQRKTAEEASRQASELGNSAVRTKELSIAENDLADAQKRAKVSQDEAAVAQGEYQKYVQETASALKASEEYLLQHDTSIVKTAQDVQDMIGVLEREKVTKSKNVAEWQRYDRAILALRQRYADFTISFQHNMKNLSSVSDPVLQQMRKHFSSVANSTSATKEEIRAASEAIKRIDTQRLRNAVTDLRSGNIKEMGLGEVQRRIQAAQQLQKDANITKQQWRQLQRVIDEGTKAVTRFREEQTKAQVGRDMKMTGGTMARRSDGEVMQAVKRMQEYAQQTRLTRKEREQLNVAIERGNARLAQTQRGDNLVRMREQYASLATLSDDAARRQQQFWLQQLTLTEKGSAKEKEYTERFRAATEEVTRRQNIQLEANRTMADATARAIIDAGNLNQAEAARLTTAKQYLQRRLDTGAATKADAAAMAEIAEIEARRAKASRDIMDAVQKKMTTEQAEAIMARSLMEADSADLAIVKKVLQTRIDTGAATKADAAAMAEIVEIEARRAKASRDIMDAVQKKMTTEQAEAIMTRSMMEADSADLAVVKKVLQTRIDTGAATKADAAAMAEIAEIEARRAKASRDIMDAVQKKMTTEQAEAIMARSLMEADSADLAIVKKVLQTRIDTQKATEGDVASLRQVLTIEAQRAEYNKRITDEVNRSMTAARLGGETAEQVLTAPYLHSREQIEAAVKLLDIENQKLAIGSEERNRNIRLQIEGNNAMRQTAQVLDEQIRREKEAVQLALQMMEIRQKIAATGSANFMNAEQLRQSEQYYQGRYAKAYAESGGKSNDQLVELRQILFQILRTKALQSEVVKGVTRQAEQTGIQQRLAAQGTTAEKVLGQRSGTAEQVKDSIRLLEMRNETLRVGSKEWNENIALINSGNMLMRERQNELNAANQKREQMRKEEERINQIRANGNAIMRGERSAGSFRTQELQDIIKQMNEEVALGEKTNLSERQKVLLIQQATEAVVRRQEAERARTADIQRALDTERADALVSQQSANAAMQLSNLRREELELVKRVNVERLLGMKETLVGRDVYQQQQNFVRLILTTEQERAEVQRQMTQSVERTLQIEQAELTELADFATLDSQRLAAYKQIYQQKLFADNCDNEARTRLLAIMQIEQQRVALNKQLTAEAAHMSEEQRLGVMAQPLQYTSEQVAQATRQSVQELDRLNERQRLGVELTAGETERRKLLVQQIDNAQHAQQRFNEESQRISMSTQLEHLTSASREAVDAQEKFWQEQIKRAAEAGQSTEVYREKLAQVQQMQAGMATTRKDASLKQITDGTYGSIEAMKQAKAEVEAFKARFADPKDVESIQKLNAAIAKVNYDIRLAENGWVGYEQVVAEANAMAGQNIKGCDAEVNRLAQSLKVTIEYFQATGNTEGLKKANEAFAKLQNAARNAGISLTGVQKAAQSAALSDEELNRIIGDPSGERSLKRLKAAYNQLKSSIDEADNSQQRYNEVAGQLRAVDKQIQRVQTGIHASQSGLDKFLSGIKSYAMFYFGTMQIMFRAQAMISKNEELADSISNVEKVSMLERMEVERLSGALASLNTRVSQSELMKIAYQGSKMGVATSGGVVALEKFTESANKLNSALGEDFGGAEAIGKLTKLAQVLKITGHNNSDLDGALERTGSAILRLGNTSTASYPYIQAFAARLGGIARTAKISMPDLLAIGSTLDTMQMPVELAATAMTKFIATLSKSPKVVAKAIGVDPQTMSDLVDAGRTMDAITLTFGTLNEKKADLQDIASRLKDFVGGGNNTRALQVITAMSDGYGTLIEHMKTSNEAFNEGTAVQREYNIMNENAAGYAHRMGNAFSEMFVNVGGTGVIGTVMKSMAQFFEYLQHNSTLIIGIIGAVMTRFGAWGSLLAKMKIQGELYYNTHLRAIDKLILKQQQQMSVGQMRFLKLNRWWTTLKGSVRAVGAALASLSSAAAWLIIFDMIGKIISRFNELRHAKEEIDEKKGDMVAANDKTNQRLVYLRQTLASLNGELRQHGVAVSEAKDGTEKLTVAQDSSRNALVNHSLECERNGEALNKADTALERSTHATKNLTEATVVAGEATEETKKEVEEYNKAHHELWQYLADNFNIHDLYVAGIINERGEIVNLAGAYDLLMRKIIASNRVKYANEEHEKLRADFMKNMSKEAGDMSKTFAELYKGMTDEDKKNFSPERATKVMIDFFNGIVREIDSEKAGMATALNLSGLQDANQLLNYTGNDKKIIEQRESFIKHNKKKDEVASKLNQMPKYISDFMVHSPLWLNESLGKRIGDKYTFATKGVANLFNGERFTKNNNMTLFGPFANIKDALVDYIQSDNLADSIIGLYNPLAASDAMAEHHFDDEGLGTNGETPKTTVDTKTTDKGVPETHRNDISSQVISDSNKYINEGEQAIEAIKRAMQTVYNITAAYIPLTQEMQQKQASDLDKQYADYQTRYEHFITTGEGRIEGNLWNDGNLIAAIEHMEEMNDDDQQRLMAAFQNMADNMPAVERGQTIGRAFMENKDTAALLKLLGTELKQTFKPMMQRTRVTTKTKYAADKVNGIKAHTDKSVVETIRYYQRLAKEDYVDEDNLRKGVAEAITNAYQKLAQQNEEAARRVLDDFNKKMAAYIKGNVMAEWKNGIEAELINAGIMDIGLDTGTEDVQEINRRMAYLMHNVDDLWKKNADELREDIRRHGFVDWADALDRDEMGTQVLLEKTESFWDQYQDIVRKGAERIKKRLEASQKTQGNIFFRMANIYTEKGQIEQQLEEKKNKKNDIIEKSRQLAREARIEERKDEEERERKYQAAMKTWQEAREKHRALEATGTATPQQLNASQQNLIALRQAAEQYSPKLSHTLDTASVVGGSAVIDRLSAEIKHLENKLADADRRLGEVQGGVMSYNVFKETLAQQYAAARGHFSRMEGAGIGGKTLGLTASDAAAWHEAKDKTWLAQRELTQINANRAQEMKAATDQHKPVEDLRAINDKYMIVAEEKQRELLQLKREQADLEEEMALKVLEHMRGYESIVSEMSTAYAKAGAVSAGDIGVENAKMAYNRAHGINQESSEYIIYGGDGRYTTKWMTEEERLKEERDIAMKNERLKVFNDALQKWGEKTAQDVTDAWAERMNVEAYKRSAEEQEQQDILDATRDRINNQMDAEQRFTALFEQELSKRMMYLVKYVDEVNTLTGNKTTNTAGKKPDNAVNSTAATNAAGAIVEAKTAAQKKVMNLPEADSVDTSLYLNRPQDEQTVIPTFADMQDDAPRPQYAQGSIINVPEAPIDYTRMPYEDEVTLHGDAQDAMLRKTQETNKAITDDQRRAMGAMIQAANLYGIAYNAVMNDNLTVGQKVGVALVQALGQTFMTMLSACLSSAIAQNTTNESVSISKVFSQMGIGAWAAIAGITASIGVATALATRAISKSKKEISALTGASNGKLTTGMLTYAEGRYAEGSRYDVDGNDGQTYSAKYEGEIKKTGIRRGTHFGIFSEKKPEMVVDGTTTQLLHTKYPAIEDAVLQVARTGQYRPIALDYGNIAKTVATLTRSRAIPYSAGRMPTFADGQYPYAAAQAQATASRTSDIADNPQMQQLIEVMNALNSVLSSGITANVSSRQASKALAKQRSREQRLHITDGI